MAIVHLFYHPRDSDWRDRVTARLLGSAKVEPRPMAAGTGSDLARHRAHEPMSAAVLLMSRVAVDAGLPNFADQEVRGQAPLFPVLVDAVDRPDVRISGGPVPRSLDGRPLAEGSREEVELFLQEWGAELVEELLTPPGVRAAASSEESANRDAWFTVLFQEHYPSLVSFFGRRGRDPELARDLAQETMIRVYRGLPEFDWRRPLRSWILTIAANVWRNWLRDHRGTQKRAGIERQIDDSSSAGDVADDAGLWPGKASDPEARLAAVEERRRLHGSVEELSPLQRQCLALWLDGWKYREIAEEVGTSLQTVRATLHKAKARLRLLLGPTDRGEGVRPANEEDT